MAETVGQHAVAAFTSPVNGTTPIDANTVRGNDNTIRVAYVDHDADPGIHVQSSALASRPIAGVAGRKWMTVDGTVTRLWYDTGSTWLEMQAGTLSTARTLWGQSFDGTANVSGNLSSVGDIAMTGALSGATSLSATNLTGTLQTAAQPNVTSVGTLSSLAVSGNVTVDTNTLFVDAANNRVGIGTASPGVSVDVVMPLSNIRATSSTGTNICFGSYQNTGGSFRVGLEGSVGDVLSFGASAYSGVIATTGAYPLMFGTNAIVRAQIDTSGNLGLGVTPSAWTANARALQVGNVGALFRADSGGVNVSQNVYESAANTYLYGVSFFATRYEQQSGQHRWFTAPSGTAGNAITFTQAMTLDANGRLLVGTTSAVGYMVEAYIASGNNGISIQNGANAAGDFAVLDFRQAGTQRGVIYTNQSNLTINANGGVIALQTGGSERARIDASGNLGIGVTPTYRLDALAGAGAGNVFRAGQLSVSNGYTITTSGTALTHRWANAGTDAMTLDASGNLGVGTAGPLGRLHVSGADAVRIALINGATRAVRIGADATAAYVEGVDQTGVGSYQPLYVGGSVVALFTGGTERARIDASGNLGLGVTPSAWGSTYRALDVRTGAMYDLPAGSASGVTFNAIFNGTNWVYKGTGGNATGMRYEMSGAGHVFSVAPSGAAGNTITFTEAMRLDASGNLVVGTTTASARMHSSATTGVALRTDANTGVTQHQFVVNGFGEAGTISATNAGHFTLSAAADAIVAASGGSERLRAKAGGQVRFFPRGSAPTVGVEDGDVYYDSTTNKLRVRAAGAWVDLH